MRVDDFDYKLPEELIAQSPLKERDTCRLMILNKDGSIEERVFSDVLDYLNPGDTLVLNDSKVIPARLYGIKESTGARIEFLLLKRREGEKEFWETLVRPGKRLKVGDRVVFSSEEGKRLVSKIEGDMDDGIRIVSFDYDGVFMERLEEVGTMPLPPYIERPSNEEDKEDYQTVYSRIEGSVAAPTAGLHFTRELLKAAEEKGVKLAYLTLHVGIGTFRPVKADTVEDHQMHFEEYEVSQEAADIINETIETGGKVISVGTTSTRTLETVGEIDEKSGKYFVKPGRGSTDIFIYPGYKFKIIDGLITNFHLPKSTLIMLVSALAGKENVLKAYNKAVEDKYRFFSYGDAMLIIKKEVPEK